mgnify:FL=1
MLIGAIASELAYMLAYLLTYLLGAVDGPLAILHAGKFDRLIVLRFGGVCKEALLATIVDIGINVLAR